MRRQDLLFSLVLLFLCQAACSRPPTLLVTVTGISPQVRSLAVLAARVNEDNSAVAPLDDLVPYDLPTIPSEVTFVLRLPADFNSKLTLSIAGFSKAGGSGCVLSTSTAVHTFLPSSLDDNLSLELLDLAPGADTTCDGAVRLLSARPGLVHAAGGDRIVVKGWGFRPDSRIAPNGVSIATSYVSAEQLEATAPPAPAIGPILLQVETANQLSSGLSALRYIVDTIEFSPLAQNPMFTGLQDAHVADLDGDHWPDLAFLPMAASSNTLTIAFQNAPLAFTVRTVSVATGLVGLFAVDIDHDGDIDLVTASADDRELKVLKNDGQGKFTVQTTSLSFVPGALIGADFTGDGNLDVVFLDDVGESVYTLENDGSGSFSHETAITLGNANMRTLLIGLDYNLDGKTDVVLDNVDDVAMTYQAEVLLNGGQGLPMDDSKAAPLIFTDQPNKPFLNPDIDGDGKPDLLLSVNQEAIHIFPSAGLSSRPEIKVVPPCSLTWMGTGDLDGDGLLDLALGCDGTARVEFMRQTQRNEFSGTPQALAVLLPPIATPPLVDCQLVDLDGDGKPELLTGNGQYTYVYHNVSR